MALRGCLFATAAERLSGRNVVLLNRGFRVVFSGIREKSRTMAVMAAAVMAAAVTVQSKIDAATRRTQNQQCCDPERKSCKRNSLRWFAFRVTGRQGGVERLKTLRPGRLPATNSEALEGRQARRIQNKVSASCGKTTKQMEAANKRADDEKAARESAERKLHNGSEGGSSGGGCRV